MLIFLISCKKNITDSGFIVENNGCKFEGEWKSNWGSMKFDQKGKIITSEYTHDKGKINGTIKGNILIGKWSESPSYRPKKDAGDVELKILDGCKEFTGNWRYGSQGNWTGGWNGTKIIEG